MQNSTFTIPASDATPIFVRRWLPDGPAKAVVQIAHGMAEHSGRYARFAQALTDADYAVYADDHRGHGQTAGTLDRAGYFAAGDGWRTAVNDLATLTNTIASEQPDLPIFLFGHSMGSFLARSYAAAHGSRLAGLVLSGTAGSAGALGTIGAGIAAAQAKLRGEQHPSALMNTLSFGQYNSAFKPNRTEFDWLTRDNAEVDAYIADPWCGFVFTAGGYRDVLRGLAAVNSERVVAAIPKDVPIYVTAGDKDPVGDNGKGVTAVAEQLRGAGVREVTLRLWPEARHEILNETNRDEITAEIIAWLDAHLR